MQSGQKVKDMAGCLAAPSARELEALCASCISMVTMFFTHGPTVLTNQVRYDTKGHFLKIFFVVYSYYTIKVAVSSTQSLKFLFAKVNFLCIQYPVQRIPDSGALVTCITS